MDLKQHIETIAGKLSKDNSLLEQFKSDPIKAVKSLLNVDLPEGVVDQIVNGVKAKLTTDKAGGIVDSIKKLF